MLCAGLIDPLWLGCLNSTGVFKGYNQLITNTEFWNNFTEKSILKEYKKYMKDECYHCYEKLNFDESDKLKMKMVQSNHDQPLYCRNFEPRGYQERIYNHNEHTDDETHQINHNSFCSPFETGDETGDETNNMNLGTDIIKKTIDFCIRGPNNKSSNYWNEAKLQRGKYKYHILKELLVNILQYTEIIDISYKNKLEIQNKIDEAMHLQLAHMKKIYC